LFIAKSLKNSLNLSFSILFIILQICYAFLKEYVMETKKRLFIGTFLKTDKLIENYPRVKSDFAGIVEGKWVEDWNLHFTYHFLGEVDSTNAEKLLADLKPITVEYHNPLVLRGLGCFPNANYPRVLFVEIFDSQNILQEIHLNCKSLLEKYNFQLDTRQFHPHLTLLRIKQARRREFREKIQKYEKEDFGQVDRFSVHLIESKLTPKGPIYQILSK
jgi:2'-5' RNA ligase